MTTHVKPRRRPALEALEPRLVLNAPTPFPGSPVELPEGHWRNTPFVGSPIVDDLDGDGRDEVITPAAGGRLVAYTIGPEGQIREFRRYETGAAADIKATPIVVDRPGGGKIVFAGLGRDESATPGPLEDGRVFAWDALTGQVLPGWPQLVGPGPNGVGGVGGPLASGDLDGDGVPEVVATTAGHFVTAFRLDGSVLWMFQNDDSILSGAAIGDIDRDGRNEVVVGSDISQTQFFDAGGLINVLNDNGSAKFRIPIGEVAWSSPVLADLTGDGFLEIIAGTGLNFSLVDTPNVTPRARDAANRLYAYDHQGQTLPGWPYRTTTNIDENRQVYSSPAVADLDGDGLLEVAIVDFSGFLHVVRADGTALPGFEGGKLLAPMGGLNDTYTSPIIADADGDGASDIIAGARRTLVAVDARGRELWRVDNPNPGTGELPDTGWNAAAVGQLDGQGGLELVSVTNRSAVPNPPRSLSVFQLDPSPLPPPWPMHRRTPDGVPVARNPVFAERYVRAASLSLLGREPGPGELDRLSRGLRDNSATLRQVADGLASTPEARGRIVDRIYRQYLERAPGPEERAAGLDLLAAGPSRDLARQLLLSPEFASGTDGTVNGLLSRMWERTLRRPLSPEEAAAFVPAVQSGAFPPEQIVDLLVRSEQFVLLDVVAPAFVDYLSVFPGATLDDAAITAALFDLNAGVSEEQVLAGLVASGGNYGRTSMVASLVRSAFADVLGRQASPEEVGVQVRMFLTGAQTPRQFVAGLIDSPEGRALFVREQVRDLLGREATPQDVAMLVNYPRREDLRAQLVASDEYLAVNGGTIPGFVTAAYRDLGGFNVPPTQAINEWVQLITSGQRTRADLANTLALGPFGFEFVTLEQLFRYLPDESQGVLRIPLFLPPGSGPTNPDPALLSSLVGARNAGATEADVLAEILTRPEYLEKVSYVRGLFRSVGQRF